MLFERNSDVHSVWIALFTLNSSLAAAGQQSERAYSLYEVLFIQYQRGYQEQPLHTVVFFPPGNHNWEFQFTEEIFNSTAELLKLRTMYQRGQSFSHFLALRVQSQASPGPTHLTCIGPNLHKAHRRLHKCAGPVWGLAPTKPSHGAAQASVSRSG